MHVYNTPALLEQRPGGRIRSEFCHVIASWHPQLHFACCVPKQLNIILWRRTSENCGQVSMTVINWIKLSGSISTNVSIRNRKSADFSFHFGSMSLSRRRFWRLHGGLIFSDYDQPKTSRKYQQTIQKTGRHISTLPLFSAAKTAAVMDEDLLLTREVWPIAREKW